MDIAYSPTGREFVTGSYDRTVRIFRVGEGKSREVYHTTRMQRVFTVNYTPDSRYVLSGSDDTNVRLWKAKSSDPLTRVGAGVVLKCGGAANPFLDVPGAPPCQPVHAALWSLPGAWLLWRVPSQALPRERVKQDYSKALQKKFGHMPEIRKIVKCVASAPSVAFAVLA